MFESSINKLEMLEQLVSMTENSEIETMSKFLYERIKHHDSYVVFLGETSSGKSSIINGLLGAPVLPMKANPSTAAITEIELNRQIEASEQQRADLLPPQPQNAASWPRWIARLKSMQSPIFRTFLPSFIAKRSLFRMCLPSQQRRRVRRRRPIATKTA